MKGGIKSLTLFPVLFLLAETLLASERFFPGDGVLVSDLDGGRTSADETGVTITAVPNRSWSGARLCLKSTFDATRFRSVTAVVTNMSDGPVELVFQAKCPSNPHSFFSGVQVLPPYAAGTIVAPVSAGVLPLPFALPGMRGYEPEAARLSPEELRRIGVFSVFRRCDSRTATFKVLSIDGEEETTPMSASLTETNFFPFVDRFGQYRHADWPGKVHDEKELVAQRVAEETWLAEHGDSPIPGADRFGGWAAGPKLTATGHFRTEKVNGKWWLVDPDGHLFYSHGIVGVRIASDTGVSGRERYFEWLPARDDVTYSACWFHYGRGADRSFYRNFGPYDAFSFPRANCLRRYGTDWAKEFAPLAHRRLRAWGVNTIGNWSDERMMTPGLTPYTDWIESRGPSINSKSGHRIPDVFAKEFVTNLERAAAKRAKVSGNDPWCLGWFVDNEISWGEKDDELARFVLSSSTNQPARIAFVRRLMAKGIDPANVPSGELCAFSREFEARYFSVVRATVKKHAPNRLYLGCRFLKHKADAVWRTASKYCDVVSVNVYRDEPAIDLPEGAEDRPLLIGEFHFGALDRGLLNAGLVPVSNQAERAERYMRYVRAARASNRIVGAHWFIWRDQALTGRSDGECFQAGFIDVTDRPYPEMVEASRTLAKEIYK